MHIPQRPDFPESQPSRREMRLEAAAQSAAPASHSETGDEKKQRQLRTVKRPPRPLSPQDETIIRTVGSFFFVTSEQITRLFYRPGSLEHVRRKLKALTDAGWLVRLRLPRATPGNHAYVYCLGKRGIDLC